MPTDRRILFEIPDYWTADQALAVFELLDDLREHILSHYDLQIIDACREQCAPSPAEHSKDPKDGA